MPVGEGQLAAVRQSLAADVRSITETVRALTVGVPLAEEKGRKLIPQHHLALSAALNREAFPTVELSLEQALSYLRREALCLPAEAPRGYVLVTYQNHPLGLPIISERAPTISIRRSGAYATDSHTFSSAQVHFFVPNELRLRISPCSTPSAQKKL